MKNFIVFVIALLLCTFLTSCNEQQKLEKSVFGKWEYSYIYNFDKTSSHFGNTVKITAVLYKEGTLDLEYFDVERNYIFSKAGGSWKINGDDIIIFTLSSPNALIAKDYRYNKTSGNLESIDGEIIFYKIR